jgi:hypothetical protein
MAEQDRSAYAAPFPQFQRWRARGPILSVLLPVICFLPLVTGLLQRAAKGRIDLIDFQGTLCAAERHAAGLSVYSADFIAQCSPAGFSYPYPPLFLDLTAGLLNLTGRTGFWYGFIALYVLAIVFIIAATLTALLPRPSFDAAANRAPLITVWTGAPIAWGNFGIPLHAVYLGCALLLPRWPLLFALAAAAISIVKPQLIVYAAVLVFAIRPFWKGAAYAVLAGLLGAAAMAYNFIAQSPAELADWRTAATQAADTGTGAFHWLAWAGLNAFSYVGLGLAAALGGLLLLSGLVIARVGGLAPRASALLGIAVVTLALPRVNDYDLMTMGLGLVALLAAVEAVSPRLFGVVAALILTALLQPIVLEQLDLGYAAAHIRHIALVVIVLGLGGYFALRRAPVPA